MNNNVEGNDEYILISIFVRAQSTRFGIYRGTRIPCATRFRNASIHRRPMKAPEQRGPYIQNFLTREFNTRRRNFDFSEDAQAPFFMRVHLSSGFHPDFHPGFHPVPSGSIRFHPVPSGSIRVSGAGSVYTRFCLPRHRLNLVLGIKLACTEFLPPHTSPPRYRHNEEVDFCA